MASITDRSDKRFQYFPQSVVDLQRELCNHPELRKELEGISEMPEWYATIATHVGIGVDGAFTAEGLDALTKILISKLIQSRTSLIV